MINQYRCDVTKKTISENEIYKNLNNLWLISWEAAEKIPEYFLRSDKNLHFFMSSIAVNLSYNNEWFEGTWVLTGTNCWNYGETRKDVFKSVEDADREITRLVEKQDSGDKTYVILHDGKFVKAVKFKLVCEVEYA